jgi:hypothetical protein
MSTPYLLRIQTLAISGSPTQSTPRLDLSLFFFQLLLTSRLGRVGQRRRYPDASRTKPWPSIRSASGPKDNWRLLAGWLKGVSFRTAPRTTL